MIPTNTTKAVFGFALALSFTASALAADVPPADRILDTLRPQHPRLLVAPDTFARLQKLIADDPEAKALYRSIRGSANSILDDPPAEYEIPDGKRLLSVSRRVLYRVTTLALVYKIDGDRKYLDRAWTELNAAAKFKDWNPAHFLDTGEMTHAFAIGYDWLYHDWSDAQRKTIRTAIVELGLKPGLRAYDGTERYGWWAQRKLNWNQVCNGGMIAGALAVAEDEPRIAAAIVHAAVRSLPLALHEYAPDGGFPEGPGYWGYATKYTVLALAALDTALGKDFGLSDLPGLADTGRYAIHMTGPRGTTFNYCDSGAIISGAPYMRWLAERYDTPAYARFAAQRPKQSAFDLVWYRPIGEVAPPPRDKYFRKIQAVTMRSRWDDPDATFIGIQAGTNDVGHGHLDQGAFVLDAAGERWAVDMFHDNYNLPGFFGSKRYTYYRNRAESHNTLVLNPSAAPDQDPESEGRIERFVPDDKRPFAIADLSNAYATHARSVRRGIALIDRRDVLVHDEIASDKPVDAYWLMHTEAEVDLSADGRIATLRQNGKTLTAVLIVPADARFTVPDARPLPGSPRPKGQLDEPNLRRLTVRVRGERELSIVVRFNVGDRADAADPEPLADW